MRIGRIKILGEDGAVKIDQSARKILKDVGVIIPHERMVKLFDKAGAEVDYHSGRVKIPSKLIDECLEVAGKRFTIYGRDKSRCAKFGEGERNYNSIAGEAYWVDDEGNRRFAKLEDVIVAGKFGEVLDNINIVGAMADPYEIDPSYRCVEVVANLIRTTTKPITFWFHDGPSAKFVVELIGAVAGGMDELRKYPITYPFLEPISPLRFAKDGIDVLFETAKVGLPVSIGPMVQAGLSGPVTLGGTIVQEVAEILAGICVVELISPGVAVCFGGIPHCFDMRTMQMIFAGPEQGLMGVAMVEMGKYYGLPVYINVGLTDSKCVDGQAGLEIGVSLFMGMLGGADIFGHLGIAGVDQASSIEMLIFQNEIISYLERIMCGFEIDEEHLAVELIEEIGHSDKSFIEADHTLRFFREELWFPTLLDRNFWDRWEKEGKRTILDRIKDYKREIIKQYQPTPLSKEVERDIEKVVSSAKKYLLE